MWAPPDSDSEMFCECPLARQSVVIQRSERVVHVTIKAGPAPDVKVQVRVLAP